MVGTTDTATETKEAIHMGTWKFDPFHTQVEFSAKHFGMMTVRGHFTEVATSGEIDPDNPANSSIEVTINVSSLTTNNAQRDNDLRSSYFLELDKYPTITFRNTRIEPIDAAQFTLTGDLMIKGTTKPVTLQVRRYGEINRKDFGMEFDMLADNKLVVSHEIKVYIEMEVLERKEQPAAPAAARA